jgi:hypothetical protein
MARGGKRKGAGRPAGSHDIATSAQKGEIGGVARTHAAAAVNALVAIVTSGQSEATRVSAAVAILDRGYGRPAQSLEHSGPAGSPVQIIFNKDDLRLL